MLGACLNYLYDPLNLDEIRQWPKFQKLDQQCLSLVPQIINEVRNAKLTPKSLRDLDIHHGNLMQNTNNKDAKTSAALFGK